MGRIASTVAALGNGTYDGDIGCIRIPNSGEMIKLFWDVNQSRWVSEPLPVINLGDDSSYVPQVAAPKWTYLGIGTSSNQRWSLRSGGIENAGAWYAAGLRLQDRIAGRFIHLATLNAHYSPWFYQFNAGETVVFDNDQIAQVGKTWNGLPDTGDAPATLNLGHGAVLDSGVTNVLGLFKTVGTYGDALGGYAGLTRSPGWDYVKFFTSTTPAGSALGGVPTTTPTVPTKKFLYPTFYGYGDGVSESDIASLCYEVRWTT